MMMNLEMFNGASAVEAPSSAALSAAFAAAPVILAAATALPPNVVEQQSLAALLKGLWGEKYDQSRRWRSTFERIQRSVRIDRRYLALPVSEYPALDSFAKTNAAYTRVAPELGAAAAQSALAAAGITARDVDHLFFVTGTGIATPSLDARIVNRLGMRSDVRRTPIFGLGCAGGVAGVGPATTALRRLSHPERHVVSGGVCAL